MHTSLRMGAMAALLAATAAPPRPLAAQASTRSVPETYAITNARIVPGSGPAIERGTVVIRDGLIAAVGANVAAPADARIVDGSGLTVYPGLIDAFGSLGIPAPAPQNGGGRGGAGGAGAATGPAASGPQPGSDADHPWGITPEVLAVDVMQVDEHTFDGPRSAGITTALSAPTTRLSARARGAGGPVGREPGRCGGEVPGRDDDGVQPRRTRRRVVAGSAEAGIRVR